MNIQTILLRLAGFIAIAIAGGFLCAITANILVALGLVPDMLGAQPFGKAMLTNAVFVWMGTILVSFISVFIKDNWRWVLYTAPLYAPSIFAIIFTLSNKGAV